MIAVGDTAPDFTLPATGGDTVTLSKIDRPVVLFFYPRDDTSGCTKENEDFTRLLPEFEAAGVAVYGLSKDSIASHDKFMAKKNLGVPLLSDEDSDTCENYGVWSEKKMYGKTFMGITRATFLIGADGTVLETWPKVKVPGHAEAVLERVRAL
ncbi:peroxiredoxin [Litorisediminicola beolgyonensis]|uniref:thioredoxin-dependent peroxiredoxin n=1 Tax=Litorisediminicola beolgyonensis TaxID=1173614 RepID=A0ABW3ZPK0_9RHOB